MKEESGVKPGGLILTEEEATTVARVLDSILQSQPLNHSSPPHGQTTSREQDLIALARNVLIARRQRTAFLSPSLVGEPAWDMLLAIYIQTDGMPVTEAVEQSGAAPTTALRWLEHLKDHGLIDKTRSTTDRRMWLVSMSAKGRAALDGYFGAMPLHLRGVG